jgi:peptidoglycan/xylan/chitin deacetylase (PgdA/CDA1 family)
MYTSELLDILKNASAKATFSISGSTNGKEQIDKDPRWTDVIQRMDREGHQIASHTWSHSELDNMTSEERKEDLWKNEQALDAILGKYPTYLRPPYVNCSEESGCLNDTNALGYHVFGFSVDSRDTSGETNLTAMVENFDFNFDEAQRGPQSMLIIQHDTIPVSALELTKYILSTIEAAGWNGT